MIKFNKLKKENPINIHTIYTVNECVAVSEVADNLECTHLKEMCIIQNMPEYSVRGHLFSNLFTHQMPKRSTLGAVNYNKFKKIRSN